MDEKPEQILFFCRNLREKEKISHINSLYLQKQPQKGERVSTFADNIQIERNSSRKSLDSANILCKI